MALSLRALGGLGAALLLTACGTTAPPAITTSPLTTPTSSPSLSDSPAPSGPPSETSPSASASTSASATPSATPIVLQPKGIDKAPFGTAEAAVTALLSAAAGKPDDSYSGPVCELNDATPYGRQLLYGGAAFLFQSKAKGNSKSPRTFTSWVVNLDQPLNASMKLADGYPVDTTFAKLKSAFPAGKLSKIALGESAVYVFRTPTGIWYRGDDNKTPTDVGAGAMGTCE